MQDIPDLVFESVCFFNIHPQNVCLLKVAIRTKCEICSELTIKTPRRQYSVFILNLKEFSHLVLVLQLQAFKRQLLPEKDHINNTISQNKIFYSI